MWRGEDDHWTCPMTPVKEMVETSKPPATINQLLLKLPPAATGVHERMILNVLMAHVQEEVPKFAESFQAIMQDFVSNASYLPDVFIKQVAAPLGREFMFRIAADIAQLIPNDFRRREYLMAMQDIEIKEIFKRIQVNDMRLQKVDLEHVKLTDSLVRLLAKILGGSKTDGRRRKVKCLILDGCGIDDLGAKQLAKVVENNTGLTELHLARNTITTTGMLAIATALERNASLQHVDFYDNQLGNTRRHDIAVTTLMHSLERNNTLSELNLGNNGIGPAGAEAIATIITKFSEQQELKRKKLVEQKSHAAEAAEYAVKQRDLVTRAEMLLDKAAPSKKIQASQNLDEAQEKYEEAQQMADYLADRIANGLPEEQKVVKWNFQRPPPDIDLKLTRLLLYRNKIGDGGASVIGRAVAVNSTLTEVNLGYNYIGDAGAAGVAMALLSNTMVTELNLGCNQIGPKGAKALAAALQANSTLQSVLMGSNKVGCEGASEFAAALHFNTSIKQMTLFSNGIGADGAAALADALDTNRTLVELNLGHNRIGDAGASAMALALAHNTSLIRLYAEGNAIGRAGIDALATCLRTNTTLAVLQLGWNRMGAAGAQSIAQLCRVETDLRPRSVIKQINCGGKTALPQEPTDWMRQLRMGTPELTAAEATEINIRF